MFAELQSKTKGTFRVLVLDTWAKKNLFWTDFPCSNYLMDLSQLPTELQARIIKLQSCDKDLYEISNDIVNMCNTIKNLLKGPGKRTFRNVLGGFV